MLSIPADVREQTCRWALQLEGLPELMRLRLTIRLAYTITHVGKLAEARRILDDAEPQIATADDPTAASTFEQARLSLALADG